MDIRIETIMDFANYQVNRIQNEIITIIRRNLNDQESDFMEQLKEKMIELDFIESYLIDDKVSDWAYDYYDEE